MKRKARKALLKAGLPAFIVREVGGAGVEVMRFEEMLRRSLNVSDEAEAHGRQWWNALPVRVVPRRWRLILEAEGR